MILVGLVAAFIASKTVNRTDEGYFLDAVLGSTGALAASALFNLFGKEGVTGFNVASLVLAAVGAAVLLVLYHSVYLSTR